MIQVQGRTTAEMGGDKDGIVTTRLLVPTNQIGCLLGKGGSIIEDMRRATRANIRILPKDTLPRCALESDELVQVCQGLSHQFFMWLLGDIRQCKGIMFV